MNIHQIDLSSLESLEWESASSFEWVNDSEKEVSEKKGWSSRSTPGVPSEESKRVLKDSSSRSISCGGKRTKKSVISKRNMALSNNKMALPFPKVKEEPNKEEDQSIPSVDSNEKVWKKMEMLKKTQCLSFRFLLNS